MSKTRSPLLRRWALRVCGAAALAAGQPAAALDGLSLKPTRTLELRLSEGTWMHPDLSPDGKTILFNILGDIFAVDAQGGAARPILTGMAFETTPVWSPDGARIAFVTWTLSLIHI